MDGRRLWLVADVTDVTVDVRAARQLAKGHGVTESMPLGDSRSPLEE